MCSLKGCKEKPPLPGHTYRIEARGKPFHGKLFCSLLCVETYVKSFAGEWEIALERFSHVPKANLSRWQRFVRHLLRRRTIHYIELRRPREGFRLPRESREAGAT